MGREGGEPISASKISEAQGPETLDSEKGAGRRITAALAGPPLRCRVRLRRCGSGPKPLRTRIAGSAGREPRNLTPSGQDTASSRDQLGNTRQATLKHPPGDSETPAKRLGNTRQVTRKYPPGDSDSGQRQCPFQQRWPPDSAGRRGPRRMQRPSGLGASPARRRQPDGDTGLGRVELRIRPGGHAGMPPAPRCRVLVAEGGVIQVRACPGTRGLAVFPNRNGSIATLDRVAAQRDAPRSLRRSLCQDGNLKDVFSSLCCFKLSC